MAREMPVINNVRKMPVLKENRPRKIPTIAETAPQYAEQTREPYSIHAFGAGDDTGAANLMEKAWQTGKAGVLSVVGALKELESQASPVTREQSMGQFSGLGDLGRAVSESRETGESIDAITDRLETERLQRREAQKKALQDKATELFDKSAIAQEQAKEGLSPVGGFMVDMGVTGIQMAGDALMNAVAPGSGLFMMGLRSYGQAANEARREGKSEEQQFLAGLKSAGIETLTEKMFGAFGKIYGKAGADELVEKLVTKLTSNKTGQALLTWIVNGAGEGVEEVTSDILNPLADRILQLDDGNGPVYSVDDAAQMGYDFLLGAAMGLVGGSVQAGRGVKQGKAQTAESAYYENLQKNGLFNDASAEKAAKASEAMRRAMPREYTEMYRSAYARPLSYALDRKRYERDVQRNTAPEINTKAAAAVEAVTRGETITGNQAAAIARDPVAVEVLEQRTGVKLDTDKPISQVKRDIAGLASREVTQEAQRATPPSPAAQKRAERRVGGFLENGQKAYQEMSQTAEDAPSLYAGFSSVYNAGLSGIEADKAKGKYAAMLTPEQRYAAYNAGLEDARAQLAQENAEVASVTTTAGAGLADNEYSRGLIATKKDTAATLNAWGKKLGVRIEIVDQVLGGRANGQYIKEQNLIQIAADSDKPLLNVTAHEITHRMQDLFPAEYRKFRQAAMEYKMRENGADTEAEIVEKYMEAAEQEGVTLTRDGVLDELAADFAGDMLDDAALFSKFSKENRTAAQKLLDSLKEFLNKVRGLFTGKYRDMAAQEAYGKDFAELEDIAKQWQAAFDAAARQVEKAKNAAGEGDGVRYSLKTIIGNSGKDYGIGVYLDSTLLENLTAKEREQMVKERVKELGGQHFTAYDGNGNAVDVQIAAPNARFVNKNGKSVPVNKDLATKNRGSRIKQEAVVLADELVSAARYKKSRPANYPHGWLDDNGRNEWAEWKTYIQDKENSVWEATLHIATSATGEKFLYDIDPIKMAEQSGNSDTSTANISIPADGENVKPQFSLKAPVEETKNLLALHNLTEKNLLDAAKLGGLPMPSIAIVKADEGHGEYGDISLVFSKDTIDPQLFRANKVYGYDAWTPTAPQIEYEVNEKAAKKIHDLFYRMERAKGRSFADPLYSAANTLEDELNRKGGVDKVVGSMRDDPRVMNIYLEDTGRGAVDSVIKREVTRMDDNQQEMASFLIRELGDGAVNDFRPKGNESPVAARKLWYKDHGEALNAALRKYYEKLGLSSKDAADVVNAETVAAKTRYLLDARKYLDGNTEIVTEEVDRDAANKAIRDKVNQKEYEQWLDDLFDGVVKNEGIYNGKDYYTSSGNRRSFSATHYEITLENIVKAMKQGDQKGTNTFFGGQAIWGVASKDYGSIGEIKADSGRLQKMTEEEYSAIRQKYSERLAELTNEIKDPSARNEFIASDDAASAIVETLRTKRTVAGIDKELRTYPTLQIKPDTAEKVLQLYEDISNMPTGYFEAKPQRAVGFDEVLAAVIPNNASAKVKAALENAGVRMIEYAAGDEKSRLDAVNSVENARFQMRGTKRLSEDLEDLRDTYIRKYGEMPAGENAERTVRLPKKTSDKESISQTVRTILEAKATPDDLTPTIEEMALRGEFSYEAYSDKNAIADATAEIKRVGWAQALTEWTSSVRKGNVSKKNTAMGWALYNNAANSGDTATALTVLNNMVEHQRSAAQALQATRILKKLSPETQLYQVQRSVENLQEEMNKRYGDKKSPKLKIDQELAERFMRAKNQTERDNALTDIYRDIGRQMPSRLIDKWNAWRYLAMLGNARTHVRNIVGNAGFAPVVALKNTIAIGIEAGTSRVTGGKLERSKTFAGGAEGKALRKAAAADFAKIQDAAMGGGKYSEFQNANKHIEEGRVIFQSKIPGLKQVSKGLEWARKANSVALDAEDMWFSKPHYAHAMAQYCKAHGITAEMIAKGENIEKARQYAIKEAQKATYRDTNAFSQFASEIGRRSRQGNRTGVEKVASGIVEGILPFRKTPANILVRGVEYSPIGLMRGIKQAVFDVKAGKITGAEAIDTISAGLTGTALVGLGALLASQALLRGHGGDDDDKNKFEELQGHQAYSLELPDGTSITLDWLAPECLPLFIGVNLWEQTNGGKTSLTLAELLEAISNVSEPLLEMSCLQSLNDVLDVVGYAKSDGLAALPKAMANAATSYLTQSLPTLLGQAERTGEDKRYTTYTDKNAFLTTDMQYTLGRASARIPGWDYKQIPFIDAWGRTEYTGKAAARAFNNFLNPAFVSEVNKSPMETELMRLYDATGESVFPSRAGKTITVSGERVNLTAEKYVKYAEKKGKGAYDRLTNLTKDAEYKKLTDAEKVQCVDLIYTFTDQMAKTSVSKYTPDSWVTKAAEAEKKGISVTDFVIAKTKAAPVEALKDRKGNSIPYSKGLLIMERLYAIPRLTSEQRRILFIDLGVSEKVAHYNKALVQQELNKMRKK